MRLQDLRIYNNIADSLRDINTQKICRISSAVAAIAAVGIVFATVITNPSFLVALPILGAASLLGAFSTIAKLFERTVDTRATGLEGLETSDYFDQYQQGLYNINLGNERFGLHLDYNSFTKELNFQIGANRA